MRIVDLDAGDEDMRRQAAALLMVGFRANWPGSWSDMDSALQEIREALEPGKICRVAVDDNGAVLGWVGGISGYHGNVWELHPLVVDPACERRGIGRALVLDLEAQVKQRGGVTITLGTDDVSNMTTLSGVDLYVDTWQHIANIRNLRGHPYEFYQKLGFVIVGVMPDANGPGKPDILMAKRVT
ncbi:MAG: GNAT family N-acetyltransferase [Chloroflexi bacterium]|nr:GNAT family N-acetyltransferase [Chloroflexota bacterium]